jgi:hypothetical protein
MTNNGTPGEGFGFRELVRECGGDPQIVETFNRLYGYDLACPIVALVDDSWIRKAPSAESDQIASFIVFIHQQLWVRYQRAVAALVSPVRLRERVSLQIPHMPDQTLTP